MKLNVTLLLAFSFRAPCISSRMAASGLAAASRLVMNFSNECQCSIHLVIGWPDRARHRRRWRSHALIADNTIPVGRCFCVRSFLRADEQLVARTPGIRTFDRQLAPRRQHRSKNKTGGNNCDHRNTGGYMVAQCAILGYRLSDSHLKCSGHLHSDSPVAG